ncbi:SET domain-containing protein [Phytophthora infestans]|uniref:SET domain-containing protein n=1 Tax=Phytophthora infestans TaxID=4787 RepID=A0A8S9TZ83_PHYIN|nr:SET domain-containing protein [Phytophthora infestans]
MMRCQDYQKMKHVYMLQVSADKVIDATRIGGCMRFVNHSCDPNCQMEKWNVRGQERVDCLRFVMLGVVTSLRSIISCNALILGILLSVYVVLGIAEVLSACRSRSDQLDGSGVLNQSRKYEWYNSPSTIFFEAIVGLLGFP